MAFKETVETLASPKVSSSIAPLMEENNIKDKILKGAESLFLKYGVRSISMDDIARHLSVSKKTLYHHFTDKDEIITQVTQAHLSQNLTEMDECRAGSENAMEELAKISGCLRRNMEQMNPSLLFDLQKYHPKAFAVWMHFKHSYIRESVVRNLEQGIKEGYFRKEINTEVMAALRMLTVEAPFDDRIYPKDKFNLVEVQAQVFDHFVYGLCTEKGRKLYQQYKAKQDNPQQILSKAI